MKDETVTEKEVIVPAPVPVAKSEIVVEVPVTSAIISEPAAEITVDTTPIDSKKSLEIPTQTFYKVTVRDGKQVIHKVEDPVPEVIEAKEEVVKEEVVETEVVQPEKEVKVEKKEEKEKKEEEKRGKEPSRDSSKKDSHHRSKHKSSSNKSSSSHNSSSKDKSSSNSSSSSSKDRDRDKHRDKDRHKDKKHRDKDHRSNGSIKSSSGSSKDKEKQAEKDKATLAKIQPQSIDKLGKIPKKLAGSSDKSKTDKKPEESPHKHKPSMSIEVRKKGEGDRPKTVKVFNSKLRSTGLEEAPKPPPSRTAVKKSPATLPSVMPVKRPSPSREAPPPPEKKIKLPDHEEKHDKPGGIKLIPPKPKRKYFLFFDTFTDMEIVFQRLFRLRWQFAGQRSSSAWSSCRNLVGIFI